MRDSSDSKPEKRHREEESEADLEDYVKVVPQAPFLTNCMPGQMESVEEDESTVLAWNMVGYVTLRKQ